MELPEPKKQWFPTKTYPTAVGIVKDVKLLADDMLLIFDFEGNEYQMSMWGTNYERLYKKWTNQTENWKNKRISIVRDEKPGEKPRIVITPM